MSLSWNRRKDRLSSLLKSQGDEDADGLALDRLLHGQNVIGKTSRTTEIDSLRFQDKDLDLVGTLDYGQFGVVDVVTCRFDGRVYVRKSIEKRFALRTRDQCFPLFERNLLLQARKTNSEWAPRLLCAFQTLTHLKLVMDYAQGGTLWDVLESSPHNGKILEKDLRWWTPQIVSAVHWCHSQGYVHRDVKPHNFVLTPDAHVLLIDFGSAAPLLPPDSNGVRRLPKRYCLVPCGTCDYISPEILKAHEEALVALEMEDEEDVVGTTPKRRAEEATEGYGLETDWWSLGAMLYELACGVAPFFASDIRQTYLKIINHERSLRFDNKAPLSNDYRDFMSRLLTHAESRLGRRNIMEITDHPVFEGVDWTSLRSLQAPPDLHLPQFTYADMPPTTGPVEAVKGDDASLSQGFAFSALFQSSSAASTTSPGISLLKRSVSGAVSSPDRASFIGFCWGPPIDAFNDTGTQEAQHESALNLGTPNPIRIPTFHHSTSPRQRIGQSTPIVNSHRLSTPIRYAGLTPFGTLPRPSTIRRTAPRRTVSDREAMKQLVDCVGMSARKKVLESGRKPRILTSFSRSGSMSRKELRFVSSPIPLPDYSAAHSSMNGSYGSRQRSGSLGGLRIDTGAGATTEVFAVEDTDSEGPPSPSPRPGSAMSRSSGTPTVSSILSRTGSASMLMNGGTSAFLTVPPLPSSSERFDGVGNNISAMQGHAFPEASAPPPLPSSGGRQRAATVSSSAPSVFDILEDRHVLLMRDIGELEHRLSGLNRSMKRTV